MAYTVSAVAFALITVAVYRFLNARDRQSYPRTEAFVRANEPIRYCLRYTMVEPGVKLVLGWRKTAFFNYTHDVISLVPLISGGSSVYTYSMDVAKQIPAAEGKTQLFKPRRIVAGLLLWEDNLVAASGEDWKRHRRIVVPALTSKTSVRACSLLVVAKTIATYKEMVDGENWSDDEDILVDDFNRLSRKLALILIFRCGFGLPMPWDDAPTDQNGLTFGKSLTVVTETVIPRLIIPSRLYKLPIKRLRIMEQAWSGLGSFMHTFVETRKDKQRGDTKSADEKQRGDILSRLVAAMHTDGKLDFDEQEVIGSIFTLMFAGHETTATVITATLGFLAIHEDKQEKAYAEIINTIGDLQNLPYLLACFHESMRIYPAGMAVRELTDDIAITVKRPAEQTIVLRRGTLVVVDMITLHHNPIAFPPDTFKPSRWVAIPEKDVSMFGIGARACIGRKFSHVEALCLLALFLRDWKITVPVSAAETKRAYEERVMGKAGLTGLAFVVGPISLKLAKRKQVSIIDRRLVGT